MRIHLYILTALMMAAPSQAMAQAYQYRDYRAEWRGMTDAEREAAIEEQRYVREAYRQEQRDRNLAYQNMSSAERAAFEARYNAQFGDGAVPDDQERYMRGRGNDFRDAVGATSYTQTQNIVRERRWNDRNAWNDADDYRRARDGSPRDWRRDARRTRYND